MQPHDAGLRLAVGASGSGKTYGMRREVILASEKIPVVVIDRVREWSKLPSGVARRAAVVSTWDLAAERLRAGKRLVVVQTSDAATVAELACRWARDTPGVCGVAVPEAHRAFPNGRPLPTAVEDVACAWRHHRVAAWLDTQRLAKLHKDLTEQASACELRLYAIAGARDRRVIAEDLDSDLLGPLTEIRERFAGGEGERGWYVMLPGSAPYPLRRDAT